MSELEASKRLESAASPVRPVVPAPDGKTLIFATVGDPVAQVVAPTLMSTLFATAGSNALWLPIAAGAEALPTVFEALRNWRNFAGLTVTVPHKADALALVDTRTTRAIVSGGINAVRREPDGTLHGDMVDGLGFVAGLAERRIPIAGRSALLVGAGGAGSAIAAALAEEGLARLRIVDADPARADALASRLVTHYPALAIGSATMDVDIAINATPVGMRPDDPLPFDPERLATGTLVCDIIMHPADTALLARSRALGLPVQPGRPMLEHQAPLYLDFFGMADLR